MRLLAFNGFSGDSDATYVPMQSPSISAGFLESRRGIHGIEEGERRQRREGSGKMEVEQPEAGSQQDDISVRPSVSVILCAALCYP